MSGKKGWHNSTERWHQTAPPHTTRRTDRTVLGPDGLAASKKGETEGRRNFHFHLPSFSFSPSTRPIFYSSLSPLSSFYFPLGNPLVYKSAGRILQGDGPKKQEFGDFWSPLEQGGNKSSPGKQEQTKFYDLRRRFTEEFQRMYLSYFYDFKLRGPLGAQNFPPINNNNWEYYLTWFDAARIKNKQPKDQKSNIRGLSSKVSIIFIIHQVMNLATANSAAGGAPVALSHVASSAKIIFRKKRTDFPQKIKLNK